MNQVNNNEKRRENLLAKFQNQIAPSILSCNPLTIGAEISEISSKIEALHIDIMDSDFVPNINGSYTVVKAIKEAFPHIFLDVHLMVNKPEKLIDDFINAGADLITLHIESLQHPHRYLNYIKDQGILSGLSLNPGTPVALAKDLLSSTDVLLLMSVNPGFGGQSFISNTFSKITEAKALIKELNTNTLIEIDGGVKATNAQDLWKAGVDVLVAGSAIFGQADPNLELSKLYKSI